MRTKRGLLTVFAILTYSEKFKVVFSLFDDADIRIHSRIAHSFYEYHLESYTKHAKKKNAFRATEKTATTATMK